MFIAGHWADAREKLEVINPYDGSVVDTVPSAEAPDVDRAIESAVAGASEMASVSAYDRARILYRAAEILRGRSEEIGKIITLEEGKVLAEGVLEASRSCETLTVSAEEARRIHGETVPLDGAPGGAGKFGFTMRVPCGVVVAITPYNFPLNLVCHKVGPAIAAGNAVIVKPASDTPLSALKLVEILLEAGLPPNAIQCITGPGRSVGAQLARDPRVRKISFTGSREVGEAICRMSGIKRVTMELGANCPLIVMPDADLEKVAAATVATGFPNAGQVCISTQRVLLSEKVYPDFIDILKPRVEALTTGDPLDGETKMGPMIRESDAERVHDWVQDAVAGGARLVTGGERQGALHAPTVVADVRSDMRVSCDELFGPAVCLTRFTSIEDAIAMANDSGYGLGAGIFTDNINAAMRFVREVHSGNLHVNWGPQWRADLMPYGGVKESGMGKEGPRYAIQEMTELKMVVFH